MGSRTYLCYINSDTTDEMVYTVTHRSAMKAAEKYGLYAGNDTITIRTHSGQILSKVRWDEQAKKYVNVSF